MDPPLSERGREEAAALRDALRGTPLRAVYSSPLARARQTAKIVAKPHELPVVFCDDLREFSVGVWEGLTTEEIEQHHSALLHQWWDAPHLTRIPGGETLEELRGRSVVAIEEVRRRHPGESVAVVAHGGVNKMILLTTLGAPLASYYRIQQTNGCVNVLEYEGDHIRVLILNETAHLSGIV